MARADGSAAARRGGAPAQERALRDRGRRTMRRLLDAGAEVFERRGYQAARVDDIVKQARTSHGTFYLYFANKEDLFRALAEEVAEEVAALSRSLGPLEAGPAGYDEIRRWLERFALLYETYGAVLRAWTESETGSSEFGRMGTDVLGGLSRQLALRVAKAAPNGPDPQLASLALVAMIERVQYLAAAGQVDSDRQAMLDTLAAITHTAIFGPRQ